ncbi:MAG TPA: DinB family protein [Candidatus Angelobacter sp.]
MPETPQQYTQRMLNNLDGQEPLRLQQAAPKKLATLLRGKNKKQLTRRPAPGKWSVAEIVAHLADAEVVVSWRLRQIIASNGASVQAFDQDVWAGTFDYAHRDARKSLERYRVLREGNITLLKSIPKPLWDNYGVHQERGNESVAHIVRMMAGHDVNHLRQIEGILKPQK